MTTCLTLTDPRHDSNCELRQSERRVFIVVLKKQVVILSNFTATFLQP